MLYIGNIKLEFNSMEHVLSLSIAHLQMNHSHASSQHLMHKMPPSTPNHLEVWNGDDYNNWNVPLNPKLQVIICDKLFRHDEYIE